MLTDRFSKAIMQTCRERGSSVPKERKCRRRFQKKQQFRGTHGGNDNE
ncbi:hypothetical protein HMPREF1986_00758 [Oribacterium sp. oral taxon 078 str. F0263]|nr:hypothetical protein HMPREF1986_00758 [Oribacterium sp. oral taxon 078 str. F0263]